jgi:hypothetical protein
MRPRSIRLSNVRMMLIVISLLSLHIAVAVSAQPLSQESTTPGTVGLQVSTATIAVDPGPRSGAVSAGSPLTGLSETQMTYFLAGQTEFNEEESIADGLGPRLNLNSCSSCHSFPAVGGSSPAVNPQVAFATHDGGLDRLPSFLTANGPVREARFVKNADGTADGGVHDLFTITGRTGATGCSLTQPNFDGQLDQNNVIFRFRRRSSALV